MAGIGGGASLRDSAFVTAPNFTVIPAKAGTQAHSARALSCR